MSRENFFEILGLLPNENDENIINQAIKKKQAEWSRLRNHPSKGRDAQKKLSLLKEIKKVMLNPSLRKKEAEKFFAETRKDLKKQEEEFRKQTDMLSAKGKIYFSELEELKKRFPDIKDIEKKITVEIVKDDKLPKINKLKIPDNILKVPDRSLLGKIESSLRLLGKRDLYHFLGVNKESDISKILEITEKKYIQNNKKANKTAEVTATSELLGIIKSLLVTSKRKLYDNYLIMEKLKGLNDLIEVSGKNGVIEREEYLYIYKEGLLNGINKELLIDYIEKVCSLNGIKLEKANFENIKIEKKDLKSELFDLIRNNEPRDLEELLAENDINLNIFNENGTTPLILATYKGFLKIVKILVESGADVNLQGKDGTTPLIWATVGNHIAIVRYLLNRGANIDKRDRYGFTPLMWAAGKNNETMVKILLQYGSNIALKNNDGKTAFEIAKDNGNIRLFYIIKDYKGNNEDDLKDKIFKAVKEDDLIFLSKQYTVNFNNILDDEKNTILHIAIKFEKRDIFEWILDNKKVNVNSKNSKGYTPLIQAVIKNDEIFVSGLLKENGINLNEADNDMITPLMWSVNIGNFYIVTSLVNKGANLNLKDKNLNTALSIAVWQNKKQIAEFLIKKGADLKIKTKSGKSLIDLAKERNNFEMINLLSPYFSDKDKTVNPDNKATDLNKQSGKTNSDYEKKENIVKKLKDKKEKKKKKPWWKFW